MTGSRPLTLDQARTAGTKAATRQLSRLGVNQRERIDIFGTIEREQIWLMFQPLDRLFGLMGTVNDGIGILINSRHPMSLQRYTAAHEYGHYVLGHRVQFDGEAHIYPGAGIGDAREVAAQTFAAHFLMPLPLVTATLRQMGLPAQPGSLTPQQAYLLSLELGSSYVATVNQSATLGLISAPTRDRLRREPPKAIKRELGQGVGPLNPWADTWPLQEQDQGRTFFPRVNDEVRVALPEVPSSGYMWMLAEPSVADLGDTGMGAEPDGRDLDLVDDLFEPVNEAGSEGRYGSGGVRHLTFRVLRPGRLRLQLLHRRPWQAEASALAQFSVELQVAPKPTGDRDRGLSTRQLPLVAAA